jgi:uncharacterized membrane protein YhaH (DUF805 family)
MAWVSLLFGFKGRTGRARYLMAELALLAAWLMLWLKLRLTCPRNGSTGSS